MDVRGFVGNLQTKGRSGIQTSIFARPHQKG